MDIKALCKQAVPFLIPVFLIIAAFLDILVMNNVFVGGYKDLLHYQLPHILYSAGGFPLWNNLWLTGFPEFANPQSDIYYPLTIPLIYLAGDIFTQVNFAILLHLFIGFLTSYLLIGLLTEKKSLRIAFSIFYIFSAMMLSRVFAGHELIVFALAWTPLLYYSFVRILYRSEYTVKNILIFALVSVLIVFTGALYYIVFPYIFMAIFLVYFLITRRTDMKAVITLAIPTVIFVLISSIKVLPVLSISDHITRIDSVDGVVDALGGGGSLESNLASFIFGTPINQGYSYTGLQYGIHESTVLIGLLSVFLIILALVYGRREITIPSFISIVFALIWADGGKNLLSFVHLLPFLSSLRCPGRVFGSLLPILLLLTAYGLIIVCRKIKEDKTLKPESGQKKALLYGTIILVIIKGLELPFQEAASTESIVSVILVFAFIALLYFEKITKENLAYIFSASVIVTLAFIILDFSLTPLVLLKTAVLACVIFGVLMFLDKDPGQDKRCRLFTAIVGVNIVICCMAGLTFIQPSDPGFDISESVDVIEAIKDYPSENAQLWAVTTGWAYEDMDYTYNFIKNGIHSENSYFGYYLKTMLPIFYSIDDRQYSTADYIVDTGYQSSGELAIENYTFMVNEDIPVTVPEYVLPNAFIIRDDAVVPVEIEEFTPDEVVTTGDFEAGDVVVLKTAYYDGWKVNGKDAVSAGEMVGYQLESGTDRVTFSFEPAVFTTGLVLTILGLASLVALIISRRKFEALMQPKQEKKSRKKK